MRIKEMKFLFEGIIFSSQVIVNLVSGSINRYEFTITFFTKYLINKYRECYFFVLENNNFKRIYTMDEKEDELVKILQDAVRELYNSVTKKFFTSDGCPIEKIA
jgi:hypothetical protein